MPVTFADVNIIGLCIVVFVPSVNSQINFNVSIKAENR